MKEFNYRKELLPFLEKVLTEKGYEYQVVGAKICVPVSGRKFHQIVKEAMCKKQEQSYRIPHGVLPFEKWINDKERSKKREEFNGMPVALLKEDRWKLERAVENGM